jgi:hypothetical protein
MLVAALATAVIVHPVQPVTAPTANASYHTITSTGMPCITVRSPQYPNGNYTGFDTICGGSSTVTYGAVSGEYIGADPMAFDQTRTVGCQVFIDRGVQLRRLRA